VLKGKMMPTANEKKLKVTVHCKRAGFRRIGRAWPDSASQVELTQAEINLLNADSMFVVVDGWQKQEAAS
jgi:hypothetical protein